MNYCIYTGKECTNCKKCEYVPVRKESNTNWFGVILVVLVIIFAISLLIISLPTLMNNDAPEPVQTTSNTPVYVQTYQPQNSYESNNIVYNTSNDVSEGVT